MKHFLFLLLCLGLTFDLAAQTILDDAKNLSSIFSYTIDTSNHETTKIVNLRRGISITLAQLYILKKYYPDSVDVNILTDDELMDLLESSFKGNPFLRVEITNQNETGFLKLEGSLKQPGGSVAAAGFSVAGLADGLSRFLVKRTKQELSQAFFEDFKRAVQKEPLVGHFCPDTKQHLLLIDQDVYQFKDYLQGLRESFISDMTVLPKSTETFLRDDNLCSACSQKANGKVLIDMLHVAQQLVDGEAPIDMIDYLARSGSAIQSANKTSEPVLYDMAGGLRYLNLISEAMRNTSSTDSLMPWYTGREVREMFKDPKFFRLFMGLLWQKAGGISFNGPNGVEVNLQNTLSTVANKAAELENWRNTISSFGEVTHRVQRSLSASASAPTAVSDDYYRYSQTILDLMESVNETGRLVLNRNTDLIPQEYVFLLKQCNALYFNVRQRNFTGALSNVIYCLNLLGKDKEEVANLLEYANFAASIAEANSPEEIENAVELFALPPGSSRMKKQPGRFSIALNAYSGISGGIEVLDGDASHKSYGAITAPLGLSMSWGLGHIKTNSATGETRLKSLGSLGFFVPLIDVGAVTTFRFKDSTSQNLPELTWSNILSPGLYVVYDFPGKWPIAFGIGGQAGPGLRKVTADGLEIVKSGARFGAFLAVDIPFTYFYLGKGKEKKS